MSGPGEAPLSGHPGPLLARPKCAWCAGAPSPTLRTHSRPDLRRGSRGPAAGVEGSPGTNDPLRREFGPLEDVGIVTVAADRDRPGAAGLVGRWVAPGHRGERIRGARVQHVVRRARCEGFQQLLHDVGDTNAPPSAGPDVRAPRSERELAWRDARFSRWGRRSGPAIGFSREALNTEIEHEIQPIRRPRRFVQ